MHRTIGLRLGWNVENALCVDCYVEIKLKLGTESRR